MLTPKERIAKTNEFVDLLEHGNRDKEQWRQKLDDAFAIAVFGCDPVQPYFIGPDGFRYINFQIPKQNTAFRPVGLDEVLSELIEYGAGVAIENDESNVWVYHPGDILSYFLFKTFFLKWGGGWGKLPNTKKYLAGGAATRADPNKEMFPPHVARCVDLYLSRYMAANPQFAGRAPGITVIRPNWCTKPEDPSDLQLNVAADDFRSMSEDAFATFQMWIANLFPRHLRLRLIFAPGSMDDDSSYKPLKEIYETAGLPPILE